MKNIFKKCFIFLGLVISSAAFTSCAAEWIDYAASDACRLGIDYLDEDGNNRNFFTDNVSQVEVYTAIDGDTVHFKMVDSDDTSVIKIRFYGIDTPESTGSIEPYGYEAKMYTKEALENAGTIVISGVSIYEYTAPTTDSTGSRYLGLVWIAEEENASYDQLQLLNLMIVQNGYSYVKNLDEFPEFYDTFIAAENQAREWELNLFSGEQAEHYNYGDYEGTSLLDISAAIKEQLQTGSDTNEYDNAKVRVSGTVAGYANHMLYLQMYYEIEDEETGEATGEIAYAGINVYCGYTSLPSKYTTVNTMIELSATCIYDENFGFQLTDVYDWPRISSSDSNSTQVLYTPDEIPDEYKVHTFEMTADELGADNYDVMFSPVTVTTDLYIYGGYEGSSSNVVCLYVQDAATGVSTDFSVYMTFAYQPYKETTGNTETWNEIDEYVGHYVRVTGIYSFYQSSDGTIRWQILPRDSSDMVVVDELYAD